jgi:hypothetical protein
MKINLLDNHPMLHDIMSKMQASGTQINEHYVRNLIKGWTIRDFKLDEQGNINNDYVKQEIDKRIEQFQKAIPLNLRYDFFARPLVQLESLFNSPFCSGMRILLEFCDALDVYLVNKFNSPRKIPLKIPLI